MSSTEDLVFAEDSQLTIIGKSAFEGSPVCRVCVPKNVKKIDNCAFCNCKYLKEVIFAEDSELTTIGKSAFKNTRIDKIIIPKHVDFIGENAFEKSELLKTVIFEEPSSLKVIKKSIFNKTIITEINLPSSIERLEEGWCKRMQKLNKVSFSSPNQNFKILDNKIILGHSRSKSESDTNCAFDVLYFAPRNIKEVNIPSYIKEIDSFSFQYCSQIEKLIFEEDLKLEKICEGAFSNSFLPDICIPKHVKIIDDCAFQSSKIIETIKFSKESELQLIGEKSFSKSSIKNFIVPNNVKCIKNKAFLRCVNLESFQFEDNSQLQCISNEMLAQSSIKSISIPNSVKTIDKSAFLDCHKLEKVFISDDSELVSIDKYVFRDCPIKSFHIPPHCEKLFVDSFCKDLEEFTISSKNKFFKVIDGQMIACKSNNKNNNDNFDVLLLATQNIKKAVIPSYIIKINAEAFYYCKKLTSIEISDNVKIIDDKAFNYCSSLKNVDFSDKSELEYIGDLAFSGKEFIVPKNVKEINQNTFCSMLESITFPENSELQIFHNEVFSFLNISSINFPPKLKQLDKLWAKNIENLNQISISSKNQHFKYIDKKIIAQKTNPNVDIYDTIIFAHRDIEHAIIPHYIKKINACAFEYCSKLESVEFSENSELEIIDDFAFHGTSITNINIPKNVKIIGKYAFNDSQLKSVNFTENSELNFIGENAFESTNIEKFIFPNRNIIIQPGIFRECFNLREIISSENFQALDLAINKKLRIEKKLQFHLKLKI